MYEVEIYNLKKSPNKVLIFFDPAALQVAGFYIVIVWSVLSSIKMDNVFTLTLFGFIPSTILLVFLTFSPKYIKDRFNLTTLRYVFIKHALIPGSSNKRRLYSPVIHTSDQIIHAIKSVDTSYHKCSYLYNKLKPYKVIIHKGCLFYPTSKYLNYVVNTRKGNK